MASLYTALKRRRLAFSGISGSGGLGMPPGSTLVRGAVIVTVMSWQCSLSPSSVIDGAGASQLMLAGRAGSPVGPYDKLVQGLTPPEFWVAHSTTRIRRQLSQRLTSSVGLFRTSASSTG